MGFDEWLLAEKGITWKRYLGLPDNEQDKLSNEYDEYLLKLEYE